MATTTNYGFEIPDDTDLVKDGALAMRDLGQDVDTSMFAALDAKPAAAVLLNSTSFTAQSALTIDNVFTSTYTNYKVVFTGTSSAAGSLFGVLRAAGADITSGYFNGGITVAFSGGGVTGRGGNNEAFMYFTQTSGSGNLSSCTFDLIAPQATSKKGFGGFAFRADAFASYIANGETSFTTSCTGIKIYPSSGTLTGTVQIYGMKK
jgi:hypothetical protein